MNSCQTETQEELIDSSKKYQYLLDPLGEISVHFAYLVLFLMINAYFGSSEFIEKYIVSTLNEDTARNLYVAILTTFSFIGAMFCISIIFSKNNHKLDFIYIQRIFSFGIDFLYFILLSAATIGLLVFILTCYENAPQFSFLRYFLVLFLASYVLRVVHFNFNLNIKSIKFHQ